MKSEKLQKTAEDTLFLYVADVLLKRGKLSFDMMKLGGDVMSSGVSQFVVKDRVRCFLDVFMKGFQCDPVGDEMIKDAIADFISVSLSMQLLKMAFGPSTINANMKRLIVYEFVKVAVMMGMKSGGMSLLNCVSCPPKQC